MGHCCRSVFVVVVSGAVRVVIVVAVVELVVVADTSSKRSIATSKSTCDIHTVTNIENKN